MRDTMNTYFLVDSDGIVRAASDNAAHCRQYAQDADLIIGPTDNFKAAYKILFPEGEHGENDTFRAAIRKDFAETGFPMLTASNYIQAAMRQGYSRREAVRLYAAAIRPA